MDLNIVATTDEGFDDNEYSFYPHHKFWSFRVAGVVPIRTSEIGDFPINGIYVYNISRDERDEFYNSLISLKDMVNNYLDKELVVSEELIDVDNFDYTITLA